ncbi:MAG: hypothetical protein WCB31_04085 [Nitrososphaeraceae archaeon]
MVILSKENTKLRLEEFRILLKYMPFLQKNGFSDCGRGQIMGQMFLLQEFLNDNQTNNEVVNIQQENSVLNDSLQDNTSNTASPPPQYYETAQPMESKSSNIEPKNKTFDLDSLILEDEDTTDEENKLGSRWLRPFKNDDNGKKKPLDYFEKNEITQSWKEKIRKMTQTDIL